MNCVLQSAHKLTKNLCQNEWKKKTQQKKNACLTGFSAAVGQTLAEPGPPPGQDYPANHVVFVGFIHLVAVLVPNASNQLVFRTRIEPG